MMLFPVLKKMNNLLLVVSAAVVAISGLIFKNTVAATALLLPLGIRYRGFVTLDFYPLCPYLAVFILGILAYKNFYFARQSIFPFGIENKFIFFLSKNSLLIYLLHQPFIIAVIYCCNIFAKKGFSF
jgi:uncharacterized membrane protein